MTDLPKPIRVSRSKQKEHWRYSLTDTQVREMVAEGLRQHLYLGGQPGTANRMEIEIGAVWRDNGNTLELSAVVDNYILPAC